MTAPAVALPNVGDISYPVLDASSVGIDRYGAEFVWMRDSRFLVLSFHEGLDDEADWHVVAVIPEGQLTHLLRFALMEVL